MQPFTEHNATDIVVASLAKSRSERFRQIMTSVISHLHAIVREVEPTTAEWMTAIDFLTRTGQICDEKRQEFILLSDVLGVSMLVDAVNHRKPSGATESTVLGPFHVLGAPALPMGANISHGPGGEPVFVRGTICDTDGRPIDGATLDVWQTSADGFYDVQDERQTPMNLRGVFRTNEDGKFWFRTIKPASYPIPTDGPVGEILAAMGRSEMRPAHIHFIVEAPGHESLTTHLFVEGDPYLESDAVFGVKETLIAPFTKCDDAGQAADLQIGNPFYLLEWDFVLARRLPHLRHELE
jgi:protocatechuate 3,4-dioxygenase beta subunit